MPQYAQGIFRQFSQNYSTVTTKQGDEYFIMRADMNGAFSGDTVNIRVKKPAQGTRKAEAYIVKILSRTTEPLVCLCKRQGKTGRILALPYGTTVTTPIILTGRPDIRPGTIASVRVTSGVEKPIGILVSIIGNERERDIEERIVLAQNHLSLTFPEVVEQAANKLRLPEHPQKRLDLRNLFTVTIDGEDAKDLDDAISVRSLDGGRFELWVHIADVAEYVRENDTIDTEARKRGTSTYLPDMVIPMLPEKLSNDLCSLHPGTPKLTLSIRMELDAEGQVIDRSIHETIIESNHRLTYTYVAQILEKKIPRTEVSDELYLLIRSAYALKKILDRRRKKEGKIDFDLPELQIIMGADHRVRDVKKRERNEAHKLIEEFMVLANEEISKFFATKKIPFLYRTHETPGELALQKLSSIAAHYGLRFDPEKPKPRDIQNFLTSIKQRPEEYHIARLTLQAMARAQYSDLLLGHYGLALFYYSHFTSPIRRYPDLQIHRIIKEYLRGKLSQERLNHYKTLLKSVAQSSSERERQAEGVERTIKDLKIIEFMSAHLDEIFSGKISSINEYGCSIELDNGIEGFVHHSSYPMPYIFDEQRQILQDKKSRSTLTVGKRVSIVVTEANKKSRRLEFTFIESSL